VFGLGSKHWWSLVGRAFVQSCGHLFKVAGIYFTVIY